MTLSTVLRPNSIAVVGASARTFVGQIALRNSQNIGFNGELYPVNLSGSDVAGRHSYPSLGVLPAVPDVALIQVATTRIAAIVDEGLALGVKGFVIPGAGFTDSGYAATELAAHLSRVGSQATIIGPNCMGVADLVTGAAPYIGTLPRELRRGSVGVVAQSGAIVEAIINAGGRVPISTAVSSGSEAATDTAAILEFFADDPETTAVLAFIETVTDAEATLASVSRLAALGKHLAVCVVGYSSTAQDGIAAHSGKLASGARVTAAALRQAGAIVADDLDELLTLGELFATGRDLPRRNRVHVVTNSGGEANMIADIAERVGIELPTYTAESTVSLKSQWPNFHVRNPLDPWGTDDYTAIYPEAINESVQQDCDIVVVAIDQQRTSGDHEIQLGVDLAGYLAAAAKDAAVLPVMLSPTSQDPDDRLTAVCREHGIALLRGARPSFGALAKVTHRRPPAHDVAPAVDPAPQLPSADVEDAALSTLASMGVRVPRCLRVRTAETAVAAAAEIGGQVVLKGSAPGLLHKTELGLVRAGLADPAAIRDEATRMLAWAAETGTHLELLVAEMVRGDLELIVGYKRDPVFGPTALVGLGGVWTEFIDDVTLHVGRLDRDAASELLASSHVGRMLSQSRSGPADTDGVITALCAVSHLGASHPEVASIDVNPLIVGRQHAIAVDAVIERSHQH